MKDVKDETLQTINLTITIKCNPFMHLEVMSFIRPNKKVLHLPTAFFMTIWFSFHITPKVPQRDEPDGMGWDLTQPLQAKP